MPAVTEPERPPRYNVVEQFLVSVVVPLVRPWLCETWDGLEHVPTRGGAVVAANHLSYSDPVVLGRFLIVGAGRFPRYLGKAELFTIPVFGRLIRVAGQIPVPRGTARAADSFAAAVAAARAGEVVGILPEGTVTHDPNLWPMAGKSGAVRVALAANSALIPVAMWGPERILPPRRASDPRVLLHALRPGHPVQVLAGAPVDLDDLRGQAPTTEILAEATDRVMNAITELLAQLRGEPIPDTRMANPRVVSHIRVRRWRLRRERPSL